MSTEHAAARAALPLDEDGHVNTSAEFGEAFLVEVTYTTEHDGSEPHPEAPAPRTVHGPFTTEAEANAWIEDYPEADDVEDWTVIPLNLVRPAPAPEPTLYLELDGFELRVSDDVVKSDLELTCGECGEVLCDAEHGDGIDTLARVAAGHVCDAEDAHTVTL